MPFDEAAAAHLRTALAAVLPDPAPPVSERKMFGGLAIMVRDHMTVGIIDDRVVARIGPEAYLAAMDAPDVGPMDFTGRPMKGWVYLMPPIVQEPARLQGWAAKALAFVSTLPAKAPKKRKGKTRRTT